MKKSRNILEEGMAWSLVVAAEKVAAFSYSPYSQFRVGAALLSKDGQIFLGTNVENASYGAAICAERSAVAQAITKGVKEFVALGIYVSKPVPALPCGICRQVLVEFASELEVFCSSSAEFLEKFFQRYNLAELLPKSFRLSP